MAGYVHEILLDISAKSIEWWMGSRCTLVGFLKVDCTGETLEGEGGGEDEETFAYGFTSSVTVQLGVVYKFLHTWWLGNKQ